MPARFSQLLFCLVVPAVVFTGLFYWEKYEGLYYKRQVRAKERMTEFIAGIKSYQGQYLKLPVEAFPNADEHGWQRTQGAILEALLGHDTKLNGQNIQFLHTPAEQEQFGGLTKNKKGELELIDPWGQPYYIIMDLNGDGKIPNPDARDNKEHPFVEASILMISGGPDHNPNTWADNVLSWK